MPSRRSTVSNSAGLIAARALGVGTPAHFLLWRHAHFPQHLTIFRPFFSHFFINSLFPIY